MLDAFINGLTLGVYLPAYWLLSAPLAEVAVPTTVLEHLCFGSGILFAGWLMLNLPGICFRLVMYPLAALFGAGWGYVEGILLDRRFDLFRRHSAQQL